MGARERLRMTTSFAQLRFALLVSVTFCFGCAGTAQDPPNSKPKPVPAAQRKVTLDDVLLRPGQFAPRLPRQVQWHPDGVRVVAVESRNGGDALVAKSTDAPSGAESDVLATLKDIGAAVGNPKLANMPAVSFAKNGTLAFDLPDADAKEVVRWHFDIASKKAVRFCALPADATASVMTASGDAVYIHHDNLFVRRARGTAIQVTSDGSAEVRYGVSVHREEFGIKDGLWADPTGRKVAFYREDLSPTLPLPLVDWTKDPAAAIPGRYPVAGTPNSKVRVGVVDFSQAAPNSVTWLDFGDADRWYTNVTWSPDGEALYVAIVNREQDAMELTRFSAATGKQDAVLFRETDREWVEPEHGPVFLPQDPTKFLWQSEREGFEQLYLVDVTGKTLVKITPRAVDISDVIGFTEGAVIVASSNDDPKTMHAWRANLDGSGMTPLTEGKGRHALTLNPQGTRAIDVWSAMDVPPRIDTVDLKLGKLTNLASSENPLRGRAFGRQEWFEVESPHGGMMQGHRILPPSFDATKKYPVLWYVYGGPHSQLVTDSWMAGANLWLHFMATQGYVVCRIDGHGTPNRGIAWEQSIHRRLGTVEIDDQLAALEAVKALPYIDGERVGLHGWSYGGFMTASLMTRAPSAFKCGIAGAPVTGWDLYETGYGERYMDTPQENEVGYKASDVRTYVKDLKGDLLIIHGTADVTVVWQNTIRLLDAFIRAGREVETMVYPGQLHGLQGPSKVHLYRKMTKWFATRLTP